MRIITIYGFVILLISIYFYNYMIFSQFKLYSSPDARIALLGDPQMEGLYRVHTQGIYGLVSLYLNDVYFRHIVSNIVDFVKPTHLVVLGDLFSFQSLPDEEFNSRLTRYNRIFGHPKILNGEIKLINITGNHDIGYANEVDHWRLNRFEKAFGAVNTKQYVADHLLVTVNSQNMDKAKLTELSKMTWDHLREIAQIGKETGVPIILFLHIPLFKPPGSCVDDPIITLDQSGFVEEQTTLSEESSKFLIEEIKPKYIFTGHDHYGCLYQHNENTTELIVRSMMGDFGGYSAVLEIVKNSEGDYDYNLYVTRFLVMYAVTTLLIALGIWLVIVCLYVFKIIVVYLWTRRKKIKNE